jgi:hypothetical protein
MASTEKLRWLWIPSSSEDLSSPFWFLGELKSSLDDTIHSHLSVSADAILLFDYYIIFHQSFWFLGELKSSLEDGIHSHLSVSVDAILLFDYYIIFHQSFWFLNNRMASAETLRWLCIPSSSEDLSSPRNQNDWWKII